MRNQTFKRVMFLLMFISILFYVSTSCWAASYRTKVLRSNGEYLENNDQVGYAWEDLRITTEGNNVHVSFLLKVWNNIGTPITQIFVCVRNKVFGCVFNRIPSNISNERYVKVNVDFTIYHISPNRTHKIYLVQTQAPSERVASDFIEIEEGGWDSKVGYIIRI